MSQPTADTSRHKSTGRTACCRHRARWALAAVVLAVGVLATASPAATQEPASSGDDYDDLFHYSDVWPDYYDGTRPAGPILLGIDKLHGLGVFEGTECGNNKLCPDDLVDRKTLAVWMVRVLEGNNAPDFVGSGQSFEARFDDIAATHPEGRFIERLAELGITAGCSTSPIEYCPEGTVSRGQLATFIVRALDLPKSDSVGFWDVDKNNKHLDSINRLVGSEIDDGCSYFRFTPLDFCPNQLVSRGELAKLLAEVVDYIEAKEIIKVSGVESSSINLAVSYDKEPGITEVTWDNPSNSKTVSHYVLQWQPTWTGFNYQRYQLVELSGSGSYRVEFRSPIVADEIYSVRIIVVYSNGDRLATDAVKIASEANQLRDLIKEQAIDVYGDANPWMVDAWRHLNGMDTNVFNSGGSRVSFSGSYAYAGILQIIAKNLSINNGPNTHRDFEYHIDTVAHELGHVYTVTNGVTKNEAPNAIGFLYLELLSSKHDAVRSNTRWCEASELYADLAAMSWLGSYSDFDPRVGVPNSVSTRKYGVGSHMMYWAACGFDLDQQTSDRIAEEVLDIAKSVFINRKIPQWFYDRYQLGDGSIDLDKLWADVHRSEGRTGNIIIYGLKDKFGGYCSADKEKIYQSQLRSLVPLPKDTPWRDAGGCPSENTSGADDIDNTEPQDLAEPEEPVGRPDPGSSADAENPSTDCTGNIPIIVASDTASQSDRYSAATLAGVLGTDCIVLAGGRNQPMSADQKTRLNSAASSGYIVGGTAAVPSSKVAGYDLKRLSGTDRWHTARLVGAEAVIIAGGSSDGSVEASADAEDPTTDCTGNIPIIVASDTASQSDRYSAATLAGVLGTDCIILAGDRNQPMPADQWARLSDVVLPGYIVGGTAAVPNSKVAGYSGYYLKRMAGDDRWHTARLVGVKAFDIAAGRR